jgi:hypothetical protein
MLAVPPGAVDGLDELLVLVDEDVLFEELQAPIARAASRTSGMERFTVTFRVAGRKERRDLV